MMPEKTPKSRSTPQLPPDAVSQIDYETLAGGRLFHPRDLLGPHHRHHQWVVRGWHPDAQSAELLIGEQVIAMKPLYPGLFSGVIPSALESPSSPLPVYRIRYHFANGHQLDRVDPYQFDLEIGEIDLYLFAQGQHRELWKILGAHRRVVRGIAGVRFAVWAPNAKRVSVIGSFCGWDGRQFALNAHGSSGVFELFVPDVDPGTLYKLEILAQSGDLRVKSDPYGQFAEIPPETASLVFESQYQFKDQAWMKARAEKSIHQQPVSIYEVHLGSWRRDPKDPSRLLSYQEIATPLIEHVKALGMTHIECLPLAEHAYYPSWGYQVTGYFSPTARYGNPDDLRWFIDQCHQADIGVILDWVPAHFPKDDPSLRLFDGTALYEHEDPRLGHHPDWGTLIFNYGRHEVRNFLLANALYWLKEFHVDGLRVDAVASMLYLDYSRKEGEWRPNAYGGRENIEAIEFLREVNHIVSEEVPDAMMIAEESTSWPNVTGSVAEGGLGFTFKWNMGWMHDTLGYFQTDPLYRTYHQNQLTFSMMYEYSESFLMPLSHDEVVHGKGSIYRKLPADPWQKRANHRLLLLYQFTRPGKKLFFMGTEFGTENEWNHDSSLDWHVLEDPERQGLLKFTQDLSQFYRQHPAFWERDHEPSGFRWIDCSDAQNSILAYERRRNEDDESLFVVALNLTPQPQHQYRIGVAFPGTYRVELCSDASDYGGSGFALSPSFKSEATSWHGCEHSLSIDLPPLSGIILRPIP